MAIDDGGERLGQVGMWIDGIEFAGLDQGGDCRPVLGPSIVACKESILPI